MLLKLKRVRWQALVLLILLFSITLGIVIGSTAANTVQGSYASESVHSVTANELKPTECNGINLTNIVDLGQGDPPTAGNDLILGTSGRDVVDGGEGNDCILGGGEDDKDCIIFFIGICFGESSGLQGGAGNDVILGGDGDDYIDGGGDYDVCYGGGGTDNINCETATQ